MTSTIRFEAYRGRLLGLAYRSMLGSRADAEDMVQDAWLKWTQADRTDVANDESFLTTIVTRLCLDRLKLERTRRQSYIGPWLPEPIVDAHALSPQTTKRGRRPSAGSARKEGRARSKTYVSPSAWKT